MECSVKTVLRYAQSGQLRVLKVGRNFRIHREDDPWKDDSRTFEDK